MEAPTDGPHGAVSAQGAVSPTIRKAAAWSWRLLVIGAAALSVVWLLAQVQVITVAMAISIILTALLLPAVERISGWGAPRAVSVALVLTGTTAILGGVLTFVVTQFLSGLPSLTGEITRSVDATTRWLADGPLGLSRDQIDGVTGSVTSVIQQNQARLTTGALSTAATVTQVVTGAFLVLFAVIFLLHGGRGIWEFVTRIVPAGVREQVREAGKAGFGSLTGFVRATFLVALVDAVGIGVGLAVLGVPLVLPLASLVFLGAFIPVIGAVVTGFVAVVIALLSKGIVVALLVLAVVLAVQQLEGNVLQPLLMGRAVHIHPLGVLLAISAGAVLAGIIGALLAVPLLAFLNSATRSLLAAYPSATFNHGPQDDAQDATQDDAQDDAQDDTVAGRDTSR